MQSSEKVGSIEELLHVYFFIVVAPASQKRYYQ